MKSIFSRRLAETRHDAGLQQHQAASQLGISQALLSHYENGAREPKLEFITKVCEFYGVSSDFLLGLSTQRSYNETVALPCKNESERELTESLRDLAVRLHTLGEAELTDAAVRLLMLVVSGIGKLLECPNSLYDPKRDAEIKLAEAEFIEHARRVSESL